ncbi:MAG: CDGSH iron-sulfur domain-containing protein [Bacteroidales bacterium]|nr:CDGSH iron-sulfur domain-containing protein [Bacteroidales bacterium]
MSQIEPDFAPEYRDQENDITNIEVLKGGPLFVKGNFKITGGDGKEINKSKTAYFCRCGGSKNMPFCDGTHRKINFNK